MTSNGGAGNPDALRAIFERQVGAPPASSNGRHSSGGSSMSGSLGGTTDGSGRGINNNGMSEDVWNSVTSSLFAWPPLFSGSSSSSRDNDGSEWTAVQRPTCSCGADKPAESRYPVTYHCQDCNEDLCEICANAHKIVKVTKDHILVQYPTAAAMTAGHQPATAVSQAPRSAAWALTTTSVPIGTPPRRDRVANDPPAQHATNGDLGFERVAPPPVEVLRVYANAVERARAEAGSLLRRTNQTMGRVEETLIQVTDMGNRVDNKFNKLREDIRVAARCQIEAIENRERYLLSRLTQIHEVKKSTLDRQQNNLNSFSLSLRQSADELNQSTNSRHEMDLINTNATVVRTLKMIGMKCGSFVCHEDDSYEFIPPESSLVESLNNAGIVAGSGCAASSSAEGEGLMRAILEKDSCFVVTVRDQMGEPSTIGRDKLRVNITDPDGSTLNHISTEMPGGSNKVTWTPHMEGVHLLNVTLKDLHINGSPFRVHARAGRNYATVRAPKFEFGGEGEDEGKLCRPWGICCSREGLILVANRSNNRIEVFHPNGKFSHKFGTTGNRTGQFDRPAGVVCDKKNRCIVADKDNHRVQVFTVEGEWILTFGEKGARNGQFNYPWDVACNSRDHILVSDTRNHRIQLFNPNGDFVTKYGYEGANWRHFDSPRGVCFTADNRAVVTDFNNHRLLVVNSDFQFAQFLGSEGTDNGNFTRPNGVAVDEEGHIIVADSRNNRVQIFASSGAFVSAFGTSGSGPGEFDRPSGVCISPNGDIIVVDFGNNRVQVF